MTKSAVATTGESSETLLDWQRSTWRDYLVLAKPRITVMILLTVAVAMVFASRLLGASVSPLVWLSAMIGTSMVAASASVLNQWYERDRDFLMPRTRNRPLPSGRLTMIEAKLFGWALFLVGALLIYLGANATAAAVAFVTWFIYCWIYTPMKAWSWWNTAVGTLPGALPVMIGWTAAGGSIASWEAWGLTSIVILWQFPHFMAIAWLYKDQYTQAGFRMLTREEPSGLAAGWHAVVPAAMLCVLCFFVLQPVSIASGIVTGIAVWIAVYQLVASIKFLNQRDSQTARRLLRTSLVFLPAVFLLVVVRWGLL
ncbi:MAG: heme o synthase [Planctomycetota bacterium]|jgi:protoheme IX farnesyltransferase|nr:heme o synthase [Planctomycetaceae bacterium]